MIEKLRKESLRAKVDDALDLALDLRYEHNPDEKSITILAPNARGAIRMIDIFETKLMEIKDLL